MQRSLSVLVAEIVGLKNEDVDGNKPLVDSKVMVIYAPPSSAVTLSHSTFWKLPSLEISPCAGGHSEISVFDVFGATTLSKLANKITDNNKIVSPAAVTDAIGDARGGLGVIEANMFVGVGSKTRLCRQGRQADLAGGKI